MRVLKSNILLSSTVYTIGDFLAVGVSGFLLIPIYLRFMTPEDYGLFSIVMTMISMLGVIMGLGFHSALSRYYFVHLKDDKQYPYLSSIWLFQFIFAISLSIILLIWGRPLWSWLLPGIPEYPYFYLMLVGAVFAFSSGIFSIWLRVQEKPYGFVALQAFSTLVGAFLMLSFIIWYRGGALGAISAAVVSSLIIACITLFMLGKRCRLAIDIKHIKVSLTFGLSMMMGTLGFFF